MELDDVAATTANRASVSARQVSLGGWAVPSEETSLDQRRSFQVSLTLPEVRNFLSCWYPIAFVWELSLSKETKLLVRYLFCVFLENRAVTDQFGSTGRNVRVFCSADKTWQQKRWLSTCRRIFLQYILSPTLFLLKIAIFCGIFSGENAEKLRKEI